MTEYRMDMSFIEAASYALVSCVFSPFFFERERFVDISYVISALFSKCFLGRKRKERRGNLFSKNFPPLVGRFREKNKK